MSLFLKYSEMWDMDLGGRDRSHEIPHWFGNLVYVVVGAVCKLLFRYRVDNRQKLRAFQDATGALVICNHTSFFDVVFMYLAARPKQWVRLMGRDSLFGNAGGLLGQILSRVGAFPVKRDTADMTSIKRAVRMLKNDELVGILPEGTRRGKTDRVPSLHAGVSVIARMAKVSILPMTVRGVERIKNKGERVRFPKVTVDYGDPILVSDFDFLPKEERVEACTWYAMRESFALFYRVPAEEVDMVALFPETRDYAPVFAEHPIPRHTSEEVAAAARTVRAEKEAKAAARAEKDEKAAAKAEGAEEEKVSGSESTVLGKFPLVFCRKSNICRVDGLKRTVWGTENTPTRRFEASFVQEGRAGGASPHPRRSSHGSDSREAGRRLLRGAAGPGHGRRGDRGRRSRLYPGAAHPQPPGGGRAGGPRGRGRGIGGGHSRRGRNRRGRRL